MECSPSGRSSALPEGRSVRHRPDFVGCLSEKLGHVAQVGPDSMQNVNRADVPSPACLVDHRSDRSRSALEEIFSKTARVSAQSRIDMRAVALQDEELDQALSRLFRGHCAFCEAATAIEAYRFRPTEEAGPSSAAPPGDADRSHLYYSWLTDSWQNLYPICRDCLPQESSVFPTIGRRCPLPSREQVLAFISELRGSWPHEIEERPILLDPCGNENFRRHLAVVPTGALVGLTSRGAYTIEHFALNRPQLVSDRARTFSGLLDQMLAFSEEQTAQSDFFAFSQLIFGGSWYLLLCQIARMLAGRGDPKPNLSRRHIRAFYDRQLSRPDFTRRLGEAYTDLVRHPEQVTGTAKPRIPSARGDARPVRFTITNFKALEKVEIALPVQGASAPSQGAASMDGDVAAHLAPAVVILGENAAGKSSILEAIALVLSDQVAIDGLNLETSDFILNPEWMGGDAGPKRTMSVEAVYENGDEARLAIDPRSRFQQTRDMARIPVFAYGAFRLFRKADKRTAPSSKIRSLFEPDYVLPNPEAWLVSLAGTPLLEEVARALKSILAVEQSVDVIEVDPEKGGCTLVVGAEVPGLQPLSVRTPLAAVSSGFRAVLAMACDVMRGLSAIQGKTGTSLARARAVVLIDEVEAHLHPKWKMRIIQGLREALPNVTFIATTHDPLCLRGLAPSEVRVFRRVRRADTGDDVLPTFVEQLEDLPAMGGLTVEQLLTSDLFQMHTTDAPALEASFARAGDLLARARADDAISGSEEATLRRVRDAVRGQIGRSIPIGSTDVERLIQEAVERYLIGRRGAAQQELSRLRADTRDAIVAALGEL